MSLVEFYVNGKKCIVVSGSIPLDTTLSAYIRYKLALPGTKAMCLQASCGACIVSVRALRQTSGKKEVFAVNSCMVLVFSCHGWDITTIEGVGNRLTGFGEIQKRIAAFNGTQCGYCTPGWVMSLHSLLAKNSAMTMSELESSFGSNTCRCTGYRPILDTVKSFALDASPRLCQRVNDIEDLYLPCESSTCKRQCSNTTDDIDDDWTLIDDKEVTVLKFEADKRFIVVDHVDQVFEVLRRYGTKSYMFVDGNTAKAQLEEPFEYPQLLIDISNVETLKKFWFDQNLVLGGNVPLQECIQIFKNTANARSEEFAYLSKFAEHFELIAHIPVRNIGSLAGNLMIKHKIPHFPSDVFLLFAAVRAMITVQTMSGQHKMLTMEDFLHYDMTGVLILNVLLPPLGKSVLFGSYKIMPRYQNATANVNAAYLFKIISNIIMKASIVYGNISSNFVHARETEQFLVGKNIFNNTTLQAAVKILNKEIVPDVNPPNPSSECRRKLAVGLFYKFILSISPPGLTSPNIRSGGTPLVRVLSHGKQDFQTDSSLYPLNQALPKYEGLIQSSGEAEYANDVPPLPKEVFGAFVTSTIAVGELDTIDTKSVLTIPGVVAVLTANDIPGRNSFIITEIKVLLKEDMEILVTKYVKYFGQPVAIVVAETQELAKLTAIKVKVTYKNVSTALPVITIDQAKKDSKRLIPFDGKIEPKGKGNDIKKVIKGVYKVGGQYHYYLEPITCVVAPKEYGLEVYDATQWMELSQAAIAQCLNINQSQVYLKVRRLGGGFGGKLTSNIQATAACALVAHKLNRPCRFILPIVTNITLSGKRFPAQCEYEVGVDDQGKIQYLDASIIEDKGCSLNDNILAYTVAGFKNCYNTDYFSLKTANVLTDLPSNTFFRGPGTTESIASIEHIMEHIAHAVEKDVNEVRMLNMAQEDNDIPTLIKTFKIETNYDERVNDIKDFNQANRWKKRAIKISPMRFGLTYEGVFSALVTVYRVDGSVTITTGGIEMGQGLNTKARQVCSYELNVPVETVSILPSYHFLTSNNHLTARSVTSASVCYAVIKSCEVLKQKLAPIKEKLPGGSWLEVIRAAADKEIALTGNYSMNSKDPSLKSYYTYAVAVLEAELDVLSGRFEILRSDILEDVGLSMNPLIDVGQVEGAYVQGLGYFTSEILMYDEKSGKLLNNNALNYYVPLCLDIPADFRVKLRYNSRNPAGVLGSKAVGEMGMCTAYGITHALRHCIYESRKDSGYDAREWINIDIPYTTESILKALDVKLEEMVFFKI